LTSILCWENGYLQLKPFDTQNFQSIAPCNHGDFDIFWTHASKMMIEWIGDLGGWHLWLDHVRENTHRERGAVAKPESMELGAK
jgi:hypothetical protein